MPPTKQAAAEEPPIVVDVSAAKKAAGDADNGESMEVVTVGEVRNVICLIILSFNKH